MKRKTLCLLIIIGGLIALNLTSFPWGKDILIYEGKIACFDVADETDGRMHLVFQKDDPTDSTIYYYESGNGGKTWSQKRKYDVGEKLAKIKLISDGGTLLLFYVAPESGLPHVIRNFTRDQRVGEKIRIGIERADPMGFDAAFMLGNPGVQQFAYYSPRDKKVHFCIGTEFGRSWKLEEYSFEQPPWASQFLSLSSGPFFDFYIAVINAEDWDDPASSHVELHVHSKFETTIWRWRGPYRISSTPAKYCNPRIAVASDPNYPTIWVTAGRIKTVIQKNQGTTEDTDLIAFSRSSLGDSDWRPTFISANELESEYWLDIKSFPLKDNRWVNMARINDSGTYRGVYWAWSAGENPAAWQGITKINDHDAQGWPLGAAPKIVYSLKPEQNGGGIVYAGFGGQNLYFDAPWNNQ